jgi:hypothetical protein
LAQHLELTRVDVDRLALAHGCCIQFSIMSSPTIQISFRSINQMYNRRSSIKEEGTHTIFFCHGCEDPHDQGGLQAQEHQERAALHGRLAWRFQLFAAVLLARRSCVLVLACCVANSRGGALPT